MKKNLYLLLLFSLTGFTWACDDGDKEPTTRHPLYENEAEDNVWFYIGDIAVAGQSDGSTYREDDLVLKLVFDQNREKCNIVMYDAKFASAMPFRLDIVISGADVTKTSSGYRITGDNIIPTYNNGQPMEIYTLTDLVIDATPTALKLSSMFGDFPVEYSGAGYEGKKVNYGHEGEDFDGGVTLPPVADGSYSGLFTVAQASGGQFDMPDIVTDITFGQDGKTCDLYIHDIKFASGMPLTVNLDLPGLACTGTADGYEIKGGGYTVMGYAIENLTGTVTAGNLELAFDCVGSTGTSKASYSGEFIDDAE